MVNIADMEHTQDLIEAERQGSKDAAAAVAKTWPERRRQEIKDACDKAREANRISRKTADSLMSSIREMVHAEVTGDGEQYSRHETIVRNELNELYSRLGRLEYFIRQRLGR